MKAVAHHCANHLEDLAFALDIEFVETVTRQPSKQQCYKLLEQWVEKSGDNAMICVLCDALYACGLQHVADKQFGHILDTVLRKPTDTQPTTETGNRKQLLQCICFICCGSKPL